ncbi:MAG: pyruvate dehydrogenase (acetyl-transferring) E1 component subunit alpha [Candidatus Thermoplasmatota archaeon]|nr:pyruvate dehydrogenase (acetyl-transferring) E1 component subunit alpha [Candidatus Thermoplasmatota archaeon]
MEELFQIIGLDGSYDEKLEPKLAEKELLKLYLYMVLTRVLDTKAVALQRQGRIGFYVPSQGEEAVQIGSSYALKPKDWMVPAYREQGAALLKGFPIETLIAQLYGNREDILKGHQMPNHFGNRAINFVTPSSPVGTQLPIAVGIAWAAKLRGDKTVVLVYFGDGATSQGDFHAAMNFAGVFKVPVVFLCKNNQWAISLPFSQQTRSKSVAIKAQAYGFDGIRVDGNDVLSIYTACKKAVKAARTGKGPTLIEAVTYRMGPHSTSDDPKRYRTEEEVEEWRERDPILRFQLYLKSKGIWDEEVEANVRQKVGRLVDKAVKKAEEAGEPPAETIFDDVYEEIPWNLAEQREELFKLIGRS